MVEAVLVGLAVGISGGFLGWELAESRAHSVRMRKYDAALQMLREVRATYERLDQKMAEEIERWKAVVEDPESLSETQPN